MRNRREIACVRARLHRATQESQDKVACHAERVDARHTTPLIRDKRAEAKEIKPLDVLHRDGGRSRGMMPAVNGTRQRGGRSGRLIDLADTKRIDKRSMSRSAPELGKQTILVARPLFTDGIAAQDLNEELLARGVGEMGRGARAEGDDVAQTQ